MERGEFSLIGVALEGVGENIQLPSNCQLTEGTSLHGDARATDPRGACLIVGVPGSISGNEMRHWVLRLQNKKLVEDEGTFCRVD